MDESEKLRVEVDEFCERYQLRRSAIEHRSGISAASFCKMMSRKSKRKLNDNTINSIREAMAYIREELESGDSLREKRVRRSFNKTKAYNYLSETESHPVICEVYRMLAEMGINSRIVCEEMGRHPDYITTIINNYKRSGEDKVFEKRLFRMRDIVSLYYNARMGSVVPEGGESKQKPEIVVDVIAKLRKAFDSIENSTEKIRNALVEYGVQDDLCVDNSPFYHLGRITGLCFVAKEELQFCASE